MAGSWIGISLYRIDHAVHHVGVPASLLAKGKNDLLAIVKGPDHSEQVYVFHATDGHTNVLQIPKALGLPLADGVTVPLATLSLHAPSTIISGLRHLGIPVSHYVGVDLHAVDPASALGELATGKLSVASMMSNPTGTTLDPHAGGLAHLSRARHPGLGRPVSHERAHGAPGLGTDGTGRARHRRAGRRLRERAARVLVAGICGGLVGGLSARATGF